MARLYRGYYNLAVKRRPDTHEFWIGVYSEPALVDLERIELVIYDIPTNRHSWLGRAGHVTTQPTPSFTVQETRRRRIKTKAVKSKRTLDLWFKETRLADAGTAEDDPTPHTAPPAAQR